jgi:segregation and condensation protein B
MQENETPAAEVVETSAAEHPAVQEPDAPESPMQEPPDEEPPAEKDPGDEPEEEEPPVEDPATGEPPRDDPPSEDPESDVPPVGEPDEDSPGIMAAEDLVPEDLLPEEEPAATHDATNDIIRLRAIVEAIVYLTDEPLSVDQLAGALRQEPDVIARVLANLTAEFEKPEHGVAIREVAGGFAMATKPEHHEEVRAFVKNMQAPMKLSLPSLETLAVIAYRQPITAPEVMEVRGVQGAGVLKTLLDRKLIAAAGRKNVVGKPILYKTTKEFLVQFGLKDLAELPSLKEFEEIRRMSIADEPAAAVEIVDPVVLEPLLEAALSEPLPEATSSEPLSEPLPGATPENGN